MKKPVMRSELMEITPELALRWLELNNDNRNISDRWVEAIAADISAGNWDPNNASIGLIVREDDPNRQGNSILAWPVTKVADGQHRLWAVVRAKKSIWTWVVFGDKDNLHRDNVDRVKPRSVGDQLQLLDRVSNAKRVAAFCKVIKALEEVTVGHSVMTLEMARAIRERHATGLDWIMALTGSTKLTDKAGVGGTLAYCYPTAPDKLDTFTKQVRDGENIDRHNPAYALRAYLLRATSVLGPEKNRTQRHEIAVMTLRAALAGIKGEQLTTLKPGVIMGGSFYRDACRYFGRVHARRSK